MKMMRDLLFATFFSLIALGAIPLGGSVAVQARGSDWGCDVTDVTPGGCDFVQWQEAGCHCNYVGICENSNSCTDAWNAALDTCGDISRGGFVVEGFDCDDPLEPPVEFSFYCGPAFGCAY